MAVIITPDIGSTGLFRLAEPFDTLLVSGVQYTCKAVRTLSDIIAAGQDPFAQFYQPSNIDQVKYQQDVASGVTIISLQASTGQMVYVPSTYILSFPMVGGVPYRVMGVVVQLEALPDSIDLLPIHTQIQNLVKDTLGINCTITDVVLSETQLLDSTSSTNLEAARKVAISNRTTDTAKLVAAQLQLAQAQQLVAALQAYIKKTAIG